MGELLCAEDHPRDAELKERDTLMVWGGTVGFHGNGTSQDWDGTKAWRRRQIAYGLALFHERHHGAQARNYLAGLGVACGGVDPKTEGARCTVELAVWATCTVKFGWAFFSNRVPKEMSKPIPAVLQRTIDVSGSDILDSAVQVVPYPGDRLCHR